MRHSLADEQVTLRLGQGARLGRGSGRECVFRQNSQTKTVDGRDIGLFDGQRRLNHSLGQKARPDTAAQLRGRSLGKGHCENAIGRDKVALPPFGQVRLDPKGLPRASPGRNNGQHLSHRCPPCCHQPRRQAS